MRGCYFLVRMSHQDGNVTRLKLKLLFPRQELCQDGTCNGTNVGFPVFSSDGESGWDI
jgi:hypothetical protein